MRRSDCDVAHDFLRWLNDAPRRRVDKGRLDAPVTALQTAALSDPDPFCRARCLAVLDHVASDASTHVFLAALQDPVADVRRHAVHGLTCERCRSSDVCFDEVVPAVVDALAQEDDSEIRHQLVVVLAAFSSRSDLARQTLDTVAAHDADEILRSAASAVLTTDIRGVGRRLNGSPAAPSAVGDRLEPHPSGGDSSLEPDTVLGLLVEHLTTAPAAWEPFRPHPAGPTG